MEICIVSSELSNPEKTLKGMMKYKSLPEHIEAVFLQNILKLFAHLIHIYEIDEQYDEILTLCDALTEKFEESVKSGELEVQERASTTLVIIKIVQEEISSSKWTIFIKRTVGFQLLTL